VRKLGSSLAIAGIVVAAGVEGTQTAVANGDTRTLSFYHTHSKERLTVTFKKNGRYDPAALKQLNYFLRDWRNQKQTNMDPRLFDVVWEVYKDAGARSEVQIISSYRSPETNEGLRSRSSGVAKHSQHTLGKAMDIHVGGIPMSKIREAGLRLQRGGVGFYPTSGLPFVHLDVGTVRHWPRMSRQELARVFPDGRTVHIPSDGKPMKNYETALADARRSGSVVKGQPAPSQQPIMMASAGSTGGNLISRLLGNDDEEDTAPAAPVAVKQPERAVAAAKPQTTPAQPTQQQPEPRAAAVAIAQAIPVPQARPSLGYASEPAAATAPQMAWSRGPEANTARAEAVREMAAAASANSTRATATLASATTTPAPALPMPRPQVPVASAPATVLASATPVAPPVPEIRPQAPVTASLGLSSTEAASRLIASAVRRMAGVQTEGRASAPAATPVATAALAPVERTAKVEAAEDIAVVAVSRERAVRDGAVQLAAPQPAAVEGLIAAPKAIIPVKFGANPTVGLRSDAFAGASIVPVRTERFASTAPRAATIVDVDRRG
jgi:uncharacterized protein YcbK (DUF882 family)